MTLSLIIACIFIFIILIIIPLVLSKKAENNFKFLYEDELDLWSKMETIAQKIYGASGISAPANIKKQIDEIYGDSMLTHFCGVCNQCHTHPSPLFVSSSVAL